MAARKAWRDLSPGYKARMKGHGLTARNWNTKKGDQLRAAARGHAHTPEHPEQAAKNPAKYAPYNQRRAAFDARVMARKNQLWGSSHKHRQARSDRNAQVNPVTKTRVSRELARKFLAMSDDEATLLAARVSSLLNHGDESLAEWAFLFYH